MQGAPKRQVNAEEMLAELKRALESSTRAPDAPPSSASTAPKPGSPGPETRPSQIEGKGDRPVKANADSSVGQPTDLQKSTRPRSRRWRLTAGGVALAGAAAVCASFALINRAPDLAEREPSVAATESLVRPQTEQTLEPSSSPRAPMQDSPQAAPLQAGALETRPGAGAAAANNGSVPAGGRAEVGAPNLASSGLESTAPAFAPVPPSSPAVWVPSQIIRPDGAPITTAPSTPASTDSAHPAGTPKPAVQTAAPQAVKPDEASIATAPSTPASTDSAHPAGTPKPAARRPPRKCSSRTRRELRQRRPLPLRPIQRLLWLRRRSRRPRPPRKCSSRIRRQLRPRRPLPPRPIRRRLWLRRRSRTQRRQRMCRTNLRSHRRRRSIQRRSRLRKRRSKSFLEARNPQSNQSPRLSDDRLSRRRRKKRRDRHSPRKAPAIRLHWRRLRRRRAFSSGSPME